MSIKVTGPSVNFSSVTHNNWDKVTKIWGDTILASKTDKNKNSLTLLISGNTSERVLYSNNSRITDIVKNGIKRTIIHERNGENTIGKMIVQDLPDNLTPLVTFAKWISHSSMPKIVELKINTKHPNSIIQMVEKVNLGNSNVPANSLNKTQKEHIEAVKAENFDRIFGEFLPRKITLITTNGKEKVVKYDFNQYKRLTKIFNLCENSENPGFTNLSVVV